jgi:hypothetical protein
MQFSFRQGVYAALALAGLIGTWFFNLQFMAAAGGAFPVLEFVRGGYANAAAASLTTDLLVALLSFLVWSFTEARRLAIRHWWLFVVLTFGVAFAVAFPLFLLIRERRLVASERRPV